jgi:hypothetical protein
MNNIMKGLDQVDIKWKSKRRHLQIMVDAATIFSKLSSPALA